MGNARMSDLKMTIELLEQYRGLCASVEAIRSELKYTYMPVQSPNGRTGGGHGSQPGNPTERAAMQAMQIQEKLAKREQEQMEIGSVVEDWLMTVTDPEIEAIVRFYYILGYSWKATSTKVYGTPKYYLSRDKIYRFFGKK